MGIYHTDRGSASVGITKGAKCRLGSSGLSSSAFQQTFLRLLTRTLSMDLEVPLSGISEGDAQLAKSSQL